jgi:hypothetical protein
MTDIELRTSGLDPVLAEIYLAVNEAGDCEVGTDAEDASERLRETYDCGQIRIICMKVDIAAVVPREIEIEAALPAREDGTFELQIKS